jgi:spore germination cell wall hydrolase CwlJ-like protein
MKKRTVAKIYAALVAIITIVIIGDYFNVMDIYQRKNLETKVESQIISDPFQRDYTTLPKGKTSADKVFNEFAVGLSAEQKAQAQCLALNIFYEARGETFRGKVAVANVTYNRVHNPKFPNTFCGAINAKTYVKATNQHVCAYSWVCENKKAVRFYNKKGEIIPDNYFMWRDSAEIAVLTVQHKMVDITNGSLFYYKFNHCSKTRIKVDEHHNKTNKDPVVCHPVWAYHAIKNGDLEPAKTSNVKAGRLENHYFLKPTEK